MSDQDSSNECPYLSLGLRLRKMRQRSKESAAEVSGAVEIDVTMLERIEQGQELPSEDILMLLISHFGLGDDEAVSLWELAGYDQNDMFCEASDHDQTRQANTEPRLTKQPLVLLALDARIVYSNSAEVIADKNGVVMNFSQFIDTTQGPVPVARVGMSYEQARQVCENLQRALLRGKFASEPKALPAPRTSRSRKKPNNQQKQEE